MKLYIGHSSKLNFKEELYQPIRESHLNREHEIVFPHETPHGTENVITKNTIKTCDVVIAEVSFPTTGLGIELGWADSFGRPIICIHRKDSKISDSLKTMCKNFIEYADKNDLINKLDRALKSLALPQNNENS